MFNEDQPDLNLKGLLTFWNVIKNEWKTFMGFFFFLESQPILCLLIEMNLINLIKIFSLSLSLSVFGVRFARFGKKMSLHLLTLRFWISEQILAARQGSGAVTTEMQLIARSVRRSCTCHGLPARRISELQTEQRRVGNDLLRHSFHHFPLRWM